MDGQNRVDIKIGSIVDIVLKADQRSGRLTRGKVMKLLTKSASHPHGIKVMLEDGQVGRVKNVINNENRHWRKSKCLFLYFNIIKGF